MHHIMTLHRQCWKYIEVTKNTLNIIIRNELINIHWTRVFPRSCHNCWGSLTFDGLYTLVKIYLLCALWGIPHYCLFFFNAVLKELFIYTYSFLFIPTAHLAYKVLTPPKIVKDINCWSLNFARVTIFPFKRNSWSGSAMHFYL